MIKTMGHKTVAATSKLFIDKLNCTFGGYTCILSLSIVDY